MVNEHEIFAHIWSSYQKTIDNKQIHGDVELLAEAADRIVFPGAPDLGPKIACILRTCVVKDKVGENSKHYKVVREREIMARIDLMLGRGVEKGRCYEEIASIYKMTPGAVRMLYDRRNENLDK